MNILITSTSFQDTPGAHFDLLKTKSWNIFYLRGPLSSDALINFKENINGIICGDDEINKDVLDSWSGDTFYGISKYGIGLDKIDLEYAKEVGIKVVNCKGVNSDTVAEHVFAKILSFSKNLFENYKNTKKGEWKRFAGSDIKNKTIMIVGFGAIGKRVASLAEAFKMNVIIVDPFVKTDKYDLYENISDAISEVDFLSLHTNLDKSTFELVNKSSLKNCSKKLVIINTSRGHVVNESDIISMLTEQKIQAYLTDVLQEEPMTKNSIIFNSHSKIFISPHTASRTIDNVQNQAIESIKNMELLINEKNL